MGISRPAPRELKRWADAEPRKAKVRRRLEQIKILLPAEGVGSLYDA
jgi:hypothetical protein